MLSGKSRASSETRPKIALRYIKTIQEYCYHTGKLNKFQDENCLNRKTIPFEMRGDERRSLRLPDGESDKLLLKQRQNQSKNELFL